MSQFPPDFEFEDAQVASRRRRRSSTPGVAIASVICGIPGLCFFPLGILALILGIVGLSKTGTPGASKGRGLAIAGTVLGGVSILFIPLVIAILLPAIGASRRTAQRMENSTQLRGIHQSMVTFGNANKGFFPGLNTKGRILVDGKDTGNNGDGSMPQARAWIMLNGQFFTPEYLISPLETEPFLPYAGSGPVKPDNFSYAMLSFQKTGSPSNIGYAVDVKTAPRASAWSWDLSSQAILITDRNTGTDATTGIQSVHTDKPGQWRGSVLWADNAVTFENQPVFETKYGSGSLNRIPPGDHMFIDEPSTAANTIVGANALMVHDKP